MGARHVHRIDHDRLGRGALVQQRVHEGGVGPVLQQPAHQIGQQVFMPAHRRIGPHHHPVVEVVGGLVERLAHAVQALELDADPGVGRHPPHRGQGVGVVGGELRVEVRPRADHRPRADQVGEVCRRLGGVDRIVGPAGHLSPLDLRIPIGALDQAHHQPPAAAPRQGLQLGDHQRRPLLVGLHRQA